MHYSTSPSIQSEFKMKTTSALRFEKRQGEYIRRQSASKNHTCCEDPWSLQKSTWKNQELGIFGCLLLLDVKTRWCRFTLERSKYILLVIVSNRSRWPASGPGLDWKNYAVQFQHCPKTQPTASWQSKPGPIPVIRQVLPGLARHVGSNRWFWLTYLSIYGRTQISYC